MRMYYFAYGSNMNPHQMTLRCPEATALGAATLKNYKVTERMFADIDFSQGNAAPGVLYAITGNDMATLDIYEGFPKLYAKHYVRVTYDGKQYDAYVYEMTPETKRERDGIPYRESYREVCSTGARYYGVKNMFRPKPYVGRAKGNLLTPCVPDTGIMNLNALYIRLRKCWCKETAFPRCQCEWVPSDPSYGQCAITAMLVHDIFGGTIHRIRVSGGGTHYFNRINGEYIDLTSEQFTLYNIPVNYEPNTEVPRSKLGNSGDTKKRFDILMDRLTNGIE